MARWLILPLYVVFSATVEAAVYKCEVDGKVVFSDRPCATDAKEVQVNAPPPNVGGPTAQDYKEALSEIEAYREANAPIQEDQPAPKKHKGCKGIDIIGVAPYTDSFVPRRGWVTNVPCAKVSVKLRGYNYDIFTDTTQRRLRERFRAVFALGVTAPASGISTPEGRISKTEIYVLDLCFADGSGNITDVQCE